MVYVEYLVIMFVCKVLDVVLIEGFLEFGFLVSFYVYVFDIFGEIMFILIEVDVVIM